mmetsp:Transcript_21828/g.33583  ORF Transcript_21828/g.33583 Transcript_21828/m.33583 type:complete len:565 (+) Transcript_21828:87-1781(+)
MSRPVMSTTRRILNKVRSLQPRTKIRPSRIPFDLVAYAKKLKVGLSPGEIGTLKEAIARRKLLTHPRGGGAFTKSDFEAMVTQDQKKWSQRQSLVKYIVEADDNTFGQRLLLGLDYLGTALFAIVGTQLAGQAGMNVVGATLVGCVASTGGGTLNNCMTGNTRGGVFWMRNEYFLMIALASSILTFYLWPIFEQEKARQEFETLQICAAKTAQEIISDHIQNDTFPQERSDVVTLAQFESALQADPVLATRLFKAVKSQLEPEIVAAMEAAPVLAPALIFEWLDRDNEGVLRQHELQLVARLSVMSSPVLYVLETLALGAVAIIGAQAGISRGLSPLPSIATGVTICFGGVLRDVLCHREIALGAQSYAFATAAGASVYVGLRQLVVHRILAIPLLTRIFIAGGCTIAQRIWVYNDDAADTRLAPMRIYNPPPLLRKPRSTSQVSAEALCDAAARNDVYRLKILVKQMGHDPAAADYDGRTPLHLAASEGSYDAAIFLLRDLKVNPNPLDRWKRTPLDDAQANGHMLIAALLQSHNKQQQLVHSNNSTDNIQNSKSPPISPGSW